MARCLSVYLIKYLKTQREGLMKINKQKNISRSLVKRFSEVMNITIEDLTREYSPMETKELCLRTKVCVKMTRYNCVYDAKKRFERRGRRVTNALLVKAVGRIVTPYTEQEIAKKNHVYQCELKKENNFRLDRWKLESSSSVLSRSSTPSLDYLPPAACFHDIDLSFGLEWVEEALINNGDAELALFDAFFSKPEIHGNTSSEVFSCISDSLKNDQTLNDKAVTDWFVGARQELEHVELIL